MYKGKYLYSNQDCEQVYQIRKTVPEFSCGRDIDDELAIYAIAFDENDIPAGAGRLRIDGENHFRIDYLGVIPERRRRYIGDLLTRMLLFKAQDLHAVSVHALVPVDLLRFFARYGFTPLTVQTTENCEMQVAAQDIILEGSCSHSSKKACPGNCSLCKE